MIPPETGGSTQNDDPEAQVGILTISDPMPALILADSYG